MSRSRLVLVLVLPWAGLAGVGVAFAGGVPAARLRTVTAELVIAAAATAYSRLAGRASRRRASRQRSAGLPWHVRLRAPLWLRIDHTAHLIALGALLAALPAAVDWSAASIGVFLTLATAAIGVSLFSGLLMPLGLTLQEPGLRLHYRRVSVLVPWRDIQRVEVAGPDHFAMVSVHVRDLNSIVGSADPPTPAARRRAETAVGNTRTDPFVMLMPWTAGVDGIALQQAIDKGRSRREPVSTLN